MPKIKQRFYEAFMMDEHIVFMATMPSSSYRGFHEWTHDPRTIRFQIENMYIWIQDMHGAMTDETLEKLAIYIFKKYHLNSGLAIGDNPNERQAESMGDRLDVTIRNKQRKLPLNQGS